MGEWIKVVLVLSALAYAALVFMPPPEYLQGIFLKLPAPPPETVRQAQARQDSQAELIMYSLSTCGYCRAKRQELNAAGVSFTEYLIDREPSRKRELDEKLARARVGGGSIGVPIFETNGQMILGNPPLEDILRAMDGRPPL